MRDLSLTLFFTRRTGLCDWDRVGSLERELAIYRGLAERLRRVNLVTYGGRRDGRYAGALLPIHVAPLPRHLPAPINARLLDRRHRPMLERSHVLKTNQVPGAEVALRIARRYRKPLIVRCGYLYSRFMAAHTRNRYRVRRAFAAERGAFTAADAVVVTSERDGAWAVEHHGLPANKVQVVPNYVDTALFRPQPDIAISHDVCCVARAGVEKNVGALLEALARLGEAGEPRSCLLIGSAAADVALIARARELKLELDLRPRVANSELPALLNASRVFVLPSLHEGHPKALLEAMSCARPCIGTDVVGIRDDLRHLDNGFLCETDAPAIAAAIGTVLDDAGLQSRLGARARSHIRSRYDISRIIELELALIERLTAQEPVEKLSGGATRR